METTPRLLTDLRYRLLGSAFIPASDKTVRERSEACRTCPLYQRGNGITCGTHRDPFDLKRDEAAFGSGMVLQPRLQRIECSCPLGRWPATAAIRTKSDTFGLLTVGFESFARPAQLLAQRCQQHAHRTMLVADEGTPCICLQPNIAPLYAFDLFPDAEYVTFLSPEVFLFDHNALPNYGTFSRRGLYAYRLPSPYPSYYQGYFTAHRDLRVLFDKAKDQPVGTWWEYLVKEARAAGALFELDRPTIFFPMREPPPDVQPEAVSLSGMDLHEYVNLISQMYRSPVAWREVCRFFCWWEQLRRAAPYPPGTRIVIDGRNAGIGDLIDIAHIAEAMKEMNPGVDISVYADERKKGFVSLFFKNSPPRNAFIIQEFPPNPWHRWDSSRYLSTRIGNWAVRCGVPEPKLARPIIGKEARRFADEFTSDLPAPRVVLSPISTCRTRSWPIERYEALGLLLEKEGCSVIVVDEPEGAKTKAMPFRRMFGLGAEREAAVIARCQLLIGNDSGMAHLSASMEIPTLAICGPTEGERVFGWYKKAVWINGRLPCDGCYFCQKKGWRKECAHGCLSILGIGVEEVFLRSIRLLEG